MKNNKNIILLIVTILVLIVAIVGVSYAYLRNASTQTNENVISTLSCLEVNITDVTSAINLEKAIPISDADGLKTDGYTFKIKNNCNTRVLTEINLESLKIEEPNEAIAVNYIKYSLNGSTPVIVSSRATKTATITNATSKNLLSVILNKQEEKEYNLKLWLNQATTVEQALGKVYEGKVVIVANATNNNCVTKPSEFTNAESGTILASLNSDDYCLVDNPLTIPGRVISAEYENILATTQDDYGTSYYFRGAVENNYVVFANMCWRIVRITGSDGTNGDYNNATKLVLYNYNPNNLENPCDQVNSTYAFARYATSGNGASGRSQINAESYSTNAGIGYMYGNINGTSYDDIHNNVTDSTILNSLKTWYDSKLSEYSDDYLADTIWCNDKRVGNTGNGLEKTYTLYSGWNRVSPASNASPTLKCGINKSDNLISKFTSSNSSDGGFGNGKLGNYKIGLMTADEVAFAGAVYGTANPTYYLLKNASSGNWWWTMTPLDFNGSASFIDINTNGSIGGRVQVQNADEMRPSISLKSSVNVTGSGTASDPYVIQNIGGE